MSSERSQPLKPTTIVSPEPTYLETIDLALACKRAGRDRRTVIKWCKQYRIGSRLHERARWCIYPEALRLAANGEGDALKAYITALEESRRKMIEAVASPAEK